MLLLFILVPMTAAVLGWLCFRKREELYWIESLLTTAAVFVLALFNAFRPFLDVELSWFCDMGIQLEMDGFRRVYCLIIAFMWMMTMALSGDYFRHHHHLARYYFFNLMTLGATMGVFLAADLYTAFVFFEIMSFTSFPWVIQEETEGAIRAANTYLAVAVIGGLTALMGIFLVSWKLGTVQLKGLYAAAAACGEKSVLYVAGACILVGFGAKAGMFPLHIWLPKAHPVAPAPASALLSGVLTKSGIWGVIAISTRIFACDAAWGTMLLILGTVTMFLGALLALFSVDLKRTLACSSMSQIGFIVIGIAMMCLLGEENALAARGTVLHMLNHSLFKLVLFMCAGVVYKNKHSLDLNGIRGFGRGKIFLNIAFLLGAAGIAGIPGLNGYVSKTLLHEGIVEGTQLYGSALRVVEWIFLVSGGLTLAYMTKLYVCIFVEKPEGQEHYSGRYMEKLSYAAIGVPAMALPVLGLTASRSMSAIAEMGIDFLRGAELEETIHYFSWTNLKGGFISVAIGVAFYLLVVRTVMIRNGRYVDLWPEKLDLEELVYRPLLFNVLPTIFGSLSVLFAENVVTGFLAKAVLRISGILSRAACDIVDAVILLLKRTLFRQNAIPNMDKTGRSLAYHLGDLVDRLLPQREGEEEGHHYARLTYRVVKTLENSTHHLADGLSFALLMLVLALCAVFVYVLLIRH